MNEDIKGTIVIGENSYESGEPFMIDNNQITGRTADYFGASQTTLNTESNGNLVHSSGTSTPGSCEVVVVQFQKVADYSGIQRASCINDLRENIVDLHDGRFILSDLYHTQSCTACVLNYQLDYNEELLLHVALYVRDLGFRPIVDTDSKNLIDALESHNIQSITYQERIGKFHLI